MLPEEIHGYELTTGDDMPAEYLSPDRKAKVSVQEVFTQRGVVLSCALIEADEPYAFDSAPSTSLVAQRLCEDLPDAIEALDDHRDRPAVEGAE